MLGQEMPVDVERLLTPLMFHMEDLIKIFQYQYGNAVQLLKHLKKANIYIRLRNKELEEQLKASQAYVP